VNLASDGSFAFLWERPVTLILLAISIARVLVPMVGQLKWLRAA
jgi:putative tricarboxylic transport membrane protein